MYCIAFTWGTRWERHYNFRSSNANQTNMPQTQTFCVYTATYIPYVVVQNCIIYTADPICVATFATPFNAEQFSSLGFKMIRIRCEISKERNKMELYNGEMPKKRSLTQSMVVTTRLTIAKYAHVHVLLPDKLKATFHKYKKMTCVLKVERMDTNVRCLDYWF